MTEAGARDPRLWNHDLAPSSPEKRTWTTWNIAAPWIGMAICIPTYTLASSLVDQGWTDAIRTLHPEIPMFTFWDYKRNRWPRDAGLRLDHLLLSPAIAPRLIKAGVDRKVRGEEGASDHAPAWIVLK